MADVNPRLRALIPYLLVLAASVFLFWNTLHFGFTPRGDRPGPDVWPRAILLLMIAACAVRIVTVLRRGAGQDGGVLEGVVDEPVDDSRASEPVKRYPMLLGAGIVLTILYVASLATLGFFTATAIYMAALIRTGRYRRWPVIVVVSLAGAFAFMFVFMKIVYLSLPIGRPPFEAISLALMQLMHIR